MHTASKRKQICVLIKDETELWYIPVEMSTEKSQKVYDLEEQNITEQFFWQEIEQVQHH